jgi:alpha-L-rhamnosidase
MKAIRLRTEYLVNPLGIDVQHPRLMWNCEGGVKQSAYQIVTDNWDSGKVETSSMHAVYPKELADRERVNWKIRLFDENGDAGEWSESFFEMGISSWEAKWITGDYKVNRNERYPVDLFRKEFKVERPVEKARLYITACGTYEARIGGEKAGNFYMAPGHTDYRRRVQYQTVDVTGLLKTGKNEITLQLADGWYRGSCGAWGLKNQYGIRTKILAQLELTYTNGVKNVIVTDDSWDWCNDGTIRFADNKDGEVVEAFRVPLFRGKAKVTKHSVRPTASNNVPVTEHERFKPALITTPAGKKVLDFGQNIAGIISFNLNAKAGQRVLLKFGEMLDSDGEFTQENIQLKKKNGYTTPLQQVEYFCKDGVNEYKTTFAVFGFRYALVETEAEFKAEDFTAIAVYSDMEQTGFFESSDELLNNLFEATVWSAKGNHLDIPTDCPTRERHGWTGDAQIFFETAAYMFDFAAFSNKYLHDVYDLQSGNGKLPQIAPAGGVDKYMNAMNGSVGWSDVGILIPYRFWKMFGDESMIREFYDRMARYARFMEKRCGKSSKIFGEKIKLSEENAKYLVNAGQSYGEWAEPEDVCAFKWQDFVAPHPEVSTAYTAYVLGLMAEIADELGHGSDAEEFRSYSEGCRKAYQELVSGGKYTLDTDRQAQLVRPLALGLLNDKQKEFSRKRLITALENYGWRLGTGFLSSPMILFVLAEYDIDSAYKLLENKEIPGWLSMPKNGATTIWENWSGPFNTQGAGLGSLNHYSKGAVCEWLFKSMCGINVDGENRFVISPRPGGSFTFAKASYNSVFGKVESEWEKKDGKVVYNVVIPANCEAKIILPGGTELTAGPGEHFFEE